MMISSFRAAAIGLLLAGAAPLLAQTVAPSAPAAPAQPGRPDQPGLHAADGHRGGRRGGRHGMFAGMSDAGRTVMRDAMRAGGDRRTDHEAVKAARERMLVVLDAERLDTAALKRAMDEERAAARQSHDNRQAAMLAGFSKLSAADRKLFVANARAMKARMEARVGMMRLDRNGNDMPPPPMM